MIFTFYGFKGGVGRTLAVVHAATIFASTRGPHGSNVLVMDLDLEAPSVFLYLLPPDEPPIRRGFVELMAEYLDGGHDAGWLREELPKIVYQAADSLYVLPSGNYTDPAYVETAQRLTEAFNAGFFRDLKEACGALYDYVLIDSRTGLAEVAAAATILLGDVLVACFRPNQANVGIGMIVQRFLTARETHKDDPDVPVVPLLTPRPASHSPLAAKWADFYRNEIFGSGPLVQVPFDPVLETSDALVIKPGTLRARIEDGNISQTEDAGNDLGAPIVTAYLALAERLAMFNTARDVVAARKAELTAFLDHRYADALRYLFQAIRRQPEDREHWNTLMRRYVPTVLDDATAQQTSAREQVRQFLTACLSGEEEQHIQSPRGRAWAHVIRAAKFGKGSEDAMADVEAALTLAGNDRDIATDANFLAAQIIRFRNERTLHGVRHGEEPILVTRNRALRQALDYLERASTAGGETERIVRFRGDLHNDLGDYAEAVTDFDRAAALCPDPADALLDSAQTLEHMGHYGGAIRRYLAALEHAPANEEIYRRLVPTLYRLGYYVESRQYIDRWRRVNTVSFEPTRYLLGLAVTRGDLEEIERNLAALRNHEGSAMRIVAWALLHLGRYDEAETFVADHVDAGAYERFQLAVAFAARGHDITAILALPAESAAGGNYLALASILAGELDLARQHLKSCLAAESALPMAWRTNLFLVEAMLEAAENPEQRTVTEQLRSLLDANTENAVWTRHQIELRTMRELWRQSKGRSIPGMEERWNEIFTVWDAIEASPFAHYKPFEIPTPGERHVAKIV